MNWDQLEGKWKQIKGELHEKWGKLTDDDIDQIAGRRTAFIGRVQERYGIAQEEAARRVDEYVKALQETAKELKKNKQAASQSN